jgi:hypothetical protein
MKSLFIKYPQLLRYIPTFLQHKKYLTSIATQNIKALEYINVKFSQNSTFLLSLNHKDYSDNEEFLITVLINQDRKDLFKFVSQRLRADQNFLFHLLKLEDDRIGDIIVKNLHCWPLLVHYYKIADFYRYASVELKENEAFNLAFLTQLSQYHMDCKEVLKYLPEKYLLDFQFWKNYLNTANSFYFLNHLFLTHEKFKQKEIEIKQYKHEFEDKENHEKALHYLMTKEEKNKIDSVVIQAHQSSSRIKKI